MNRRNFLMATGGAGLVVAAGVGGFIATRTLSTALAPWQQAGGSLYADPLRKALSYALLAPNPHNRQPWQITLISETEGVLLCDLARRLPQTDPFDRQIVIGLGCFLELFALAAQADGYEADIALFPDGAPEGGEDGRLDGRPIAHVSLRQTNDVQADPLFSHCLERRTHREAYHTDRQVPQAVISDTQSASQTSLAGEPADAVGFVAKGALLEQLQMLTAQSMLVEAKNTPAHLESIELMRIGVSEVEANPDGLSLYGPMMDSLKLVGLLNREALLDGNSAAFKRGLDPMMEAATKTPAFLYISTGQKDRFAQIRSGRAYMRACLAATRAGLCIHPVSQALQEYPAMANNYARLHALLVPNSISRVQMLARIGYGRTIPPSPRWPLETRITT